METCLFCNIPEPGHPAKVDYLCSACVQLLLGSTQDMLKKAHEKAGRINAFRQQQALEFFINMEGIENEQRKPKAKRHERNFNRNRIARTARSEKNGIRSSATK